MDTLKLVGTKITDGAKAFLYKEYIYLTIWSCSFAIVLGSTVDLLEMNMHRAPSNFPYTATSYLTGSMTSILAGYIGMRIAVYTNTRVTFTCCSSVHKGFITAFRGGQVLGFCLVGLAILNIMIIILLFKACWYNFYLDEALAAGRPIDHCPNTSNAGVEAAQAQIWTWFENLTHQQWSVGFKGYAGETFVDSATKHVTFKASTGATAADYSTVTDFKAASVWYNRSDSDLKTEDLCVKDNAVSYDSVADFNKLGNHRNQWEATAKKCYTWTVTTICDKWTATTAVTGKDATLNCKNVDVTKTWGDAMTAYQTAGAWTNAEIGTNVLTKSVKLQRGQHFEDHFPNPTVYSAADSEMSELPRSSWIWSNDDVLNCANSYNTEMYKFKQRICVLTRRLFENVAGYGLGGSSVALFGRVGGGIYTKAADVGADLVGKTMQDLKEDDINNPGTIADNVGDNVGDIAGMGSDLFGSLAESTCAALVVSATSYELISHPNALFFPIAITSSGMIASWFSVLLAHVRNVTIENVQSILKFQVGASTVIMTGCVIPAIFILPETFTFEGGAEKVPLTMDRWTAYGCVMFGLWSGMIIGFITEYYTNNAYAPTKWLADACDKGPAPNIILGMALGYVSVVVPITCITATIGYGFANAGMYGIGLSALGMLGSLPVALSVDGYGPISDNAGGIAEMSGLPSEIRDLTDALDAAGNTTAAVGKGFAIGSACLVGLALFGAFITRIGDTSVDILQPTQFAGLLIGAMLPYWFTAMTMKAVGDTAYDMMDFIIKDYQSGQEAKAAGLKYMPDYEGCIKISTEASLKKMVAPGVLVIGSPLLAGFIFGPNATAGVLAGAIVSGVQVAISQSNSGGAWDNAKKEVEAHRSAFRKEAENAGVNLVTLKLEYNKLLANRYTGVIAENGLEIENGPEIFDKERFEEIHKDWMARDLQLREQHVAAVVGDTVGDPLKDTSGPAINILVKLSAITSLVFGNYLAHYHFFGNKAAPIRYANDLISYCNAAGENPNTVDMVMKNCDNWLAAGYFSYEIAAPVANAKHDAVGANGAQPGIAAPVWNAWAKKVKNMA